MEAKWTRLKESPERLFECYCEVSFKAAAGGRRAQLKRRFPDSYRAREVLESVAKFAFPCDGLQLEPGAHYSFVLTSADSKWTFGFCRLQADPEACLVLLSQLPWHDAFYRILAHLAPLSAAPERQQELLGLLKALYQQKPPPPPGPGPGGAPAAAWGPLQLGRLQLETPDPRQLPSIPQDGNLSAYQAAVSLDNMVALFAAALSERHILVSSRRPDRLSACVQALERLLYPLHWQHIFIPLLPQHLLAYLEAPMPFLVGVPEPTLRGLAAGGLAGAVLLLADDDQVRGAEEDVKALPAAVGAAIKAELRHQGGPLGEGLSRAFLRGLVRLIGGYREALQFNEGQRITFSPERFLASRPAAFQPFLRNMLELQMFRQFVEGRLELLNSGRGFSDPFEFEVNLQEERTASQLNLQYQRWLAAVGTRGGLLLRAINPSLRLAYRGLRDRSLQAYKDWKLRLHDPASASGAQPPDADQSFVYSRLE